VIQIKGSDISYTGTLRTIPIYSGTRQKADFKLHPFHHQTQSGGFSVKYLFVLAVAFCLTIIWQTYSIADRTPNLQSFENKEVIIKTPQAT
jgi:hypothetical protein